MRVRPAEGAAAGVVLVFAHGAGAGHDHPFMAGYAQALAARGIDVATFNFPYIAAGRRVPDRPPVLEAAFREAIAEAQAQVGARRALFIGGKSMGGRMATHLAAEGVDGLLGVIALGYPLHPPGKPSQLRVAHLSSIAVPVLIVQGERDAFGTPAELAPHVQAMAAASVHVVQGGDHSLAAKGVSAEQTRAVVVDTMAAWMRMRMR